MSERSRIIDFHSHILPRIDDGSHSIEMSLAMLNSTKENGIDTILATPHFYAFDEYPDNFIARRNKAYEELKQSTDFDIRLGAEVAYFKGIGTANLKSLTLDNTNYILVELPYHIEIDKPIIDDILNISKKQNLIVILAHIHRYFNFGLKKYLDILHSSGILFQWNSEAFINDKKESLRALDNGLVDILGSDTHNTTLRPQNLKEALGIIAEHNESALNRILSLQNTIIK